MESAVIDPESIDTLRTALADSIAGDRKVLDELREEVRPLRDKTRRVQPRSTTAISLVGTDGGNNRIEFVFTAAARSAPSRRIAATRRVWARRGS